MPTRVARHYIHQLMVLYPTAIHGCFARLLRDVTLISEANLRRLGPVDLVIAGWPCQGHSCTRAGQGLEDPISSIFLGPVSPKSCSQGSLITKNMANNLI